MYLHQATKPAVRSRPGHEISVVPVCRKFDLP
jgi:hypothetical protein